jgi:hypothetical protein
MLLPAIVLAAALLSGRGQRMNPVIYFNALIAVAAVGFPILSRLSSPRPGLTQVRMDARGCRQIEDMSPIDGNFWSKVQRVFGLVMPILFLVAIWGLLKEEGATPMIYAIVYSIATFLALLLLLSRKRLREIARRRIDPECHEWSTVRRVAVSPLRDGWHRIQVKTRDRFFAVIDSEVQISDESAVALLARIDAWVAQASTSG